ncbi:uncharacterized protein [Asterias amurensis]|uniref:uncharacterized protein n=1 Tax=Asterias amurensis TaxID=7602 RepID=UPI003AB73691
MQCLQHFLNPEQGTAMEKNNPLICCICNVTYQHPKILACLHSFCLVCLQTLQSKVDKLEKWIQCPICHQKSELTKTGVDGLKRNFFLGRLVDDSTLSQTLQCAHILCGLCPRETAVLAESRCSDCAKFLCQACQKIHNGIPSIFGHEILSLEEISKVVHGDLDNPNPARLKALKPRNNSLECPKHPGVKSRFFCQTCEELICTDCMVIDHPHSSHSYTTLDEAAPGKRESAKNKMTRLKMKLPDADSYLQALKKMSLELKSCADRAKKEVKNQARLNRERVDEEEKRLLKEIRLETQKQIRQLKEAEVEVKTMSKHIHNSLQCGGFFVEESTDSEFLWLYLVLMKDLEHLEQLQLPSGMSTLSFISTEIDISLGELQKIDIAEMVSGELANKLKESAKLKYGKIDMTSPASSLESSQPLAPKETDVLQKQELEPKQETSDSSSDGPNSEAENRPIKCVPQLSKTSTLPKPISQPTGKQTGKTPSPERPSNSSVSETSTSVGPEKKVEKTSLPMSNVSKPPSNPTGKPTDKTPSQEPSNSSASKASTSAGPEKKVEKTSLPMSNVSNPPSNPTGKPTDKTPSQEPSNSSASKASTSAGPEKKVDKTSPPIGSVPQPSSNPRGKPNDNTPSQETSKSTVLKPSSSTGPEKKVDKTSPPISNVSKPLSNLTGKTSDKVSNPKQSNPSVPKPSTIAEPVKKVDTTSPPMSIKPIKSLSQPTENKSNQQPSNSSVPRPSTIAEPGKKVDTTSPPISNLPIKPISQLTGKLNDKTSSQQPNNSSASKPSSSGARMKQAPLPASDRVLRSSSKSNAIDERKLEELARRSLQERSYQLQLQSSNKKVNAENNQKMVENKEPVGFRVYGVQGGSMGELQRRDETDSRFPRKDGPQERPAYLDDTSKRSSHRWLSEDCDSDDSDL